jgi:hypothetical protein
VEENYQEDCVNHHCLECSDFYLYLGLISIICENGKFLLVARKIRKVTSTNYIISFDAKDMSMGSDTYVGKMRSNFLGTKF